MKQRIAPRAPTGMRRGPAPDLRDLWRQILSGDGIGPEPGQTALEPILDRLAAREQETEQ